VGEPRVQVSTAEQDLSAEQIFQRHQFGLHMLAENFDPATIILSDECRFILGSDKR
jgi:hypothetical protein